MASLPMYVVLKSKYNSKYLEYVEEEGEYKDGVRFTCEDIHSPLSKFQVERADSDPKLVHFRCCYNGKYLVLGERFYGHIVSIADKPEKDQSKWTCTLFEPVPYGERQGDFLLKHVNTSACAALGISHSYLRKSDYLIRPQWSVTQTESANKLVQKDVFTFIDWELLVVLPRYLAFKGDNGKYLGVTGSLPYVFFDNSDSADAAVAHEVFPNPDGSIRVKSTARGKFWRRNPSWIWVDVDESNTNDIETHFWPVKVDDKTIALRSLGNDNFLHRLDADGRVCLNASAPSISKEAKLEVTELVLSRSIYNVQFHPARARRYNEHVTVMGSGAASNTTNKENSIDVKVVHTESESSSWTANVSLTLGVKTTFVTKIPLIAEGKIEISAEFTAGYEWGKVYTKENTIETVYKALVQPMTKVTVSAVGSTATCDVPYSYTQTDTLMDGTKRTYDKHDGMYTGINSFNVTYELKQENIHVN